MSPHIFISYNRDDQHRARAITDALEAEGLKVWWDTNLRAGESYDEVTEKHLREAGAVVVLWSQRSVNSKWVRAEATVGERFSKLVPAMIEECERPLRFELVQTADLTRWQGDRGDPNWRSFLQSVKSALGHQDAPSPAPAAPAAESSAGDVTIENTFWNSIKDGTDRSDFEAYLKRYPDGHFSDLARNRLAVLDRAVAEKAKPSSPPAPKAQKSAAPQRAAAPQPQAKPARPAPAAKAPAAKPQAEKPKKTNVVMLGVAALVIAGLAGVGVFALQTFKPGAPGATAPPAERETALASAEESPSTEEMPSDDANADHQAILETAEPVGEPEDIAADDIGEAEQAVAAEAGAPADMAEADIAAPDGEIDDAASEEQETDPEPAAPGPGDVFTDCDLCPQMTILPAGVFLMGSPDDEAGRFPYEGPQHEVTIESFALGTHEVTFDQWAACVEDGGCGGYTPGDAGFGRGARPALYISWRDAQSYVKWLSDKTGRTYRLPTESEWEYAARGGETSAYWWGERFDRSKAALGGTVEVGALPANGFGLHEMLGNAGEWVQDCYINNFAGTPTDGSAATTGDCGRRVVRGGTWRGEPRELRAANRSRITATIRDRSMGFRVAADIK